MPRLVGKFKQILILDLPAVNISTVMKGHEVLMLSLHRVQFEQQTSDTDK